MGIIDSLTKSPGLIALAALGIGLFIFKDKISDFFSDITGGAKTANLLGENLLSNLQGTQDLLLGVNKFFTEFEIPKFENPFEDFNLNDFLGGIFNGNGGGIPCNLPLPPDVEDTGLLTNEQRAACNCGTSIIQDIQGDVQEVCLPCPTSEPPIIIPPSDPALEDEPTDAELFAQDFPGDTAIPPEPFQPPVELPPGFEGFGPSFEGGSITEIPLCNMSIGQIAEKFGISASAAANMKFIECEQSDFDFGTNTGSGFGPGDDPLTTSLVTGGATLESEEQRAACTTCELFGLNCGICSGSI